MSRLLKKECLVKNFGSYFRCMENLLNIGPFGEHLASVIAGFRVLQPADFTLTDQKCNKN